MGGLDDDVDLPQLLLIGSGIYSGLTTALHPLNVIKTRQQASAAADPDRLMLVRSLIRSHGVRGLWAGIVPVLAGALPARAGYILALEGSRPWLKQTAQQAGLQGPSAEAVSHGGAGLAAALTSLLLYVPADVVSQRLMVTAAGEGTSLLGEMSAIRRESGLLGFFRGFGISAATGLPAGAIWWATYGTCRPALPGLVGPSAPELLQSWMAATAAAAATVAAVAPLDTIKTQVQLAPTAQPATRVAARIVREGGLLSLYAGSLPRLVHLSLWGTALIVVYEELKRLCKKTPSQAKLVRRVSQPLPSVLADGDE